MVLEKWTFHILKYYIGNWGKERRLLYVVGTNIVFTWLIFCSSAQTKTNRLCWRGMKQEKKHELMPGKYQKTPSLISHWKHLSVMLTDLFFQLQRQRCGSEVTRQSWAAEKALRCLEEGLGAPGRGVGMQNLEQGEELKGMAGEGVGEALLQVMTQGGWFRLHWHWKLWENYQISSSYFEQFQQLQAAPLIYLQREETLDLL